MFAKTFGLSNGVITILSLISGLYAANVNKIGIIAAILSLIIVDPMADSYSLYVAKLHDGDKDAFDIGKDSFLSQLLVQIIFLLVIILTPSVKVGLLLCYLIGFIIIVSYGIKQKVKYTSIITNIIVIILLIFLTYSIDRLVYKKFHK